MTFTMIRPPVQGGNGSGRMVEDITGFPPGDGFLADMFLTDEPAEREALAKKAAEVMGRAAAGDSRRPLVLMTGISVAAARSGVSFRGAFADELHHLAIKAMEKRLAERSAQSIERAEAEIDECLAENPGDFEAIYRTLEGIVELDLGLWSDVNLRETIPALVRRAGFVRWRAKRIFILLLPVGEYSRRARDRNQNRAHKAEWDDRAARRRERKQAGLSCFDTYLINSETGRAVADEEFEAATIAEVDVARAARNTETIETHVEWVADATSEKTPLGAILVEVFTSACLMRAWSIDLDDLAVRLAKAAGNPDLTGIFERTIAAARHSSGPAETEAAFSRLIAEEGITLPFEFPKPPPTAAEAAVFSEWLKSMAGGHLPRPPTEPAQALAEAEARMQPAEPSSPPTPVTDDEATERRAVARAVAEIKSGRNMCEDDLLAIVRRVANETIVTPAGKLANIMISASLQITPYMHDAIRFSVNEARHARKNFDDTTVAGRVEMMLKGVHAPITGRPGLAEWNAREVAKANFSGPTVLKWEDPDGLPRRRWLYGFLQRGEFCLTYSLGGVGKTALWIVEALAMVSCRALLGVMPQEGRGRVWCHSGEEPMHELRRRIFAACKHYGLGPDDLGDRLHVDNFESCDFVIAVQVRDGVTINKPRVDLLVNYLINNRIDVLFIDPFISIHHVNENDNSAIQQVASAWKDVAVRANVAIHFAHHSRKGNGNGQDVTQDDARGARSLLDKSRGTRPLGSMSKKEAEDFRIPVEDRRMYFYYDPTEGKPNAALATGKKQWFRTVSVFLGAGREGNLDLGESVGVVEKWTPPAHADRLDQEQIETIREAIGGRRWRVSPQAFRRTDSIYGPIAEVFDLDLDSPGDKKQAGAIYKRLKATKVVVEKMELDEDGRNRPYARLPD